MSGERVVFRKNLYKDNNNNIQNMHIIFHVGSKLIISKTLRIYLEITQSKHIYRVEDSKGVSQAFIIYIIYIKMTKNHLPSRVAPLSLASFASGLPAKQSTMKG